MPIIVSNWKMNLSSIEAQNYVKEMKQAVRDGVIQKGDESSFIFCLPALHFTVQQELSSLGFSISGQNCYEKPHGAYTGENSPSLLKEKGASYCLVGHSERRELFLESSEQISRKVVQLYKSDLIPILCIGEKRAERGSWKQALQSQLVPALSCLPESSNNKLLLAYEPCWSIGTGEVPSVDELNDVFVYIQSELSKQNKLSDVKVLYGGSVDRNTLSDLKTISDVDGFLIGRASLDTLSLLDIYNQLKH